MQLDNDKGHNTHVGTRMETPVTLPFSSGKTAATAFAAPVVVGIILLKTPRPDTELGKIFGSQIIMLT